MKISRNKGSMGDMKTDGNKFPTREEFHENIIKLRREKEKKRESIYLAYLKEQRFKQKSYRKKGYSENIYRSGSWW